MSNSLIEGTQLRPCWNCGKETLNVSISFESPMCSEECDNIKYKWYEEEVRRMESLEVEDINRTVEYLLKNIL